MNSWRYSDKKIIRLLSRFLCVFGFHIWVWFDGRPTNCGVCGKIGHKIGYDKLNAELKEKLK